MSRHGRERDHHSDWDEDLEEPSSRPFRGEAPRYSSNTSLPRGEFRSRPQSSRVPPDPRRESMQPEDPRLLVGHGRSFRTPALDDDQPRISTYSGYYDTPRSRPSAAGYHDRREPPEREYRTQHHRYSSYHGLPKTSAPSDRSWRPEEEPRRLDNNPRYSLPQRTRPLGHDNREERDRGHSHLKTYQHTDQSETQPGNVYGPSSHQHSYNASTTADRHWAVSGLSGEEAGPSSGADKGKAHSPLSIPLPPAAQRLSPFGSGAESHRGSRREPKNRPSSPPLASTTGSSFGSESNSSFRYKPLKPGQFRLIELMPAKMTKVQCRLHTREMNNCEPYRALSYAWGDADDRQDIEVDGHIVSVTTSLYGALEAIRSHHKSGVILWADALCINQKDTQERTEQVQNMADIYASADLVFIWLGPDDDDSELAVELLEKIDSCKGSAAAISKVIASKAWRENFHALVCLFERDYWDRLWIVQEVFRARTMAILCGSFFLPWQTLASACHSFGKHQVDLGNSFGITRCISRHLQRYPTVLAGLSRVGMGSSLKMKSLGSDRLCPGESLLSALIDYRGKLATDPRDKVYGLLGLLPPETRHQLRPDYSHSASQVYVNVVDIILHSTGSLDVICEATNWERQTSPITLPTWVPDWSKMSPLRGLGRSYGFKAARNVPAQFKLLDRRRRLAIDAIRLGTVESRSTRISSLSSQDDILLAFIAAHSLLKDRVDGDADLKDFYPAEISLCRTFTLGKNVMRDWRGAGWEDTYIRVMSRSCEAFSSIALKDPLRSHSRDAPELSSEKQEYVLNATKRRASGGCFCLLDEGRMGMGFGSLDTDDLVIVPLGCHTPIVIRPDRHGDFYTFVGDMYVDGYMYGRAIDEWRDGTRELRTYTLR